MQAVKVCQTNLKDLLLRAETSLCCQPIIDLPWIFHEKLVQFQGALKHLQQDFERGMCDEEREQPKKV